ncbi:MAG: hypothetical protein COB40_14125 [Marinosulfonomonas sp.]|nr:MAG: hypothetical protein COB40_14125 [Marinosulfonomonas sp.]
MRKAMYTYAWDLHEEGVETVASRLRDAGINTFNLATSYHAGKFLRPHAPRRKVYFPEDGSVYFRPDPSVYGRIKPRVASMVDEFDALRELETHAPDFDRVGWTVGLHNTPLGMAHPDITAKNAFGDPLFNSLCPSQPDVREYLVSLCADLGNNYALSELVIETPGWQAYRHGHHHEFELVELSDKVETMLGICFCDVCRVNAKKCGIDADGLAQNTRNELELFFADGTEPTIDPKNDPEWRALHAWRAEVVANLVREVRATLNPEVSLAIVPTVQSPNDLCWSEGSDLSLLADAADRLEIPVYQTGLRAMTADVENVRASAGADAKIGYILRPTYPNIANAEQTREAVKMVKGAGAETISFYNYGHMRLQSLDWIKAAFT